MIEQPNFIEHEKSDDVLAQLGELSKEQLDLEAKIKESEESLKVLKKALERISGEEIPNLLSSRGLSSIKLLTGEKIDIKKDVTVTVKDDDAFFAFLRERKEDSIIKMMFTMDRMETAKLDKLLEFLGEEGYEFDFDVNVHGNTKKKYFKGLIGLEESDEEERLAGYKSGRYIQIADLPSWCNVYVYYKTKIK